MVVAGDAVGESVHGQWLTHTGTPGQESEQGYTYDKVGRLTAVQDGTDVTCTRRTYGFNARSDRLTQSTVTGAPGAACPTTGAVTTTHTYDSVDRITDAGYGYDALGRTTTSPGAVTTAYYATDLVQRQTAGTARTSWTLDAGMRPRGWTSESNASGTWTATATRLNHYDGSGDEPKWTVEDTGTAAVTRNVESLSGDLAATTAASGGTVLQLTNLHGDVTLQLPADTAVAPTVLAADEYGNARLGAPAARYGWLGAKQRSAETPTGMVLMGVRVYNPATGRFLQTDPEPGGSCSDYDYVCADPVNAFDLDGRRCWSCGFRSAKRWVSHHKVDIALTAVSFVPGLGQAAWAYRGYRAYRAYRTYRTYRTVRYARYASRSCRNSFTPETRVLMADGTTRDIDDIAIGDLVLAADPGTGETRAEPVTDVIIGSGEKDLVTITADPDGDGHSDSVVATTGHPFYTQTGWRDAGALMTGNMLTAPDRTTFPVIGSVRGERRRSTVYNITVDVHHTYFVVLGGGSAPVHNCGGINWTRHGINQAERRGISQEMMEQAVRTGKRGKGNTHGTTRYKGRKVWVVLNNRTRCVVSCGWNKN